MAYFIRLLMKLITMFAKRWDTSFKRAVRIMASYENLKFLTTLRIKLTLYKVRSNKVCSLPKFYQNHHRTVAILLLSGSFCRLDLRLISTKLSQNPHEIHAARVPKHWSKYCKSWVNHQVVPPSWNWTHSIPAIMCAAIRVKLIRTDLEKGWKKEGEE